VECASNFLLYPTRWGNIFPVDEIDRKILAELQQDGRLTVTELAERVRLSVSPAHRRLRALERSGAIAGYRAHLDAHALGLTFEALVFVTMRTPSASRGAAPGTCCRSPTRQPLP
jgi:DNA-binding Lrp family transcriptional regulator